MRTNQQRVMHCPCGNAKVLALGLCSTCYTLKRQDKEYFGGLREAVLERDGYRCRVCDASGRTSDPLPCIIVDLVNQRSTSWCPFARGAMQRSIERWRSSQPCHRSSWSCGESSTLRVTNRCSLTSPRRSLRRSSFLFSEMKSNQPGSVLRLLRTVYRPISEEAGWRNKPQC